MTSRVLAMGASLWAAAYAVAYVLVIRSQDDSPAGWYLGLVVAASILLAAAGLGAAPRTAAAIGLGLLTVCALLGLLSIGVFLLPAVVAAAVAVTRAASQTEAAATAG
jgi:hypothetical protein